MSSQLSPEYMDARVIAALSKRIGARRGIKGRDLANELFGYGATATDERNVRYSVERLRLQGHHICAQPGTGYHMAETADELDATCEFIYNRAIKGLTQIAAMKKVSVPDLRGQLKLPT